MYAPLYSGGLGVLAGDHLKSTSYLGLPFVAVGLLYPARIFPVRRSRRTVGRWRITQPMTSTICRIQPAKCADGTSTFRRSRCIQKVKHSRKSGMRTSRTRPFISPRHEHSRKIRARNYGTSQITCTAVTNASVSNRRFLLGIGGYRALAALGIQPTICHMNEGHAAFLTIERIRHLMLETGNPF